MFNGDYTVVIVLCEIQSGALHIIFIGSRRFIRIFPGGLKGEMVPGDAHPYLVPFQEILKPPLIASGGFLFEFRIMLGFELLAHWFKCSFYESLNDRHNTRFNKSV